mgnify:CR=1 FL=1
MEKYSLYEPIIQNKIAEFTKEISLLCGEPITLEAQYQAPLTPQSIVERVSEKLEVPVKLIKSKSRKQEVQDAGRIATKLIHDKFPKLSLLGISVFIKQGGCDHTSVIARLRRHDNLIITDKQYIQKYNLCKL